MKNKIYVLILLLGVFGATYTYIHFLHSNASFWKNQAENSKHEVASLKKHLLQNQKAMLEREQISMALTAQTNTLVRSLESIYDNDEQSKKWSHGNIPDSVYKRLRYEP